MKNEITSITIQFAAIKPEEKLLTEQGWQYCKSSSRPYPEYHSRIKMVDNKTVAVKYDDISYLNLDYETIYKRTLDYGSACHDICNEIYRCMLGMFRSSSNLELHFINSDKTNITNKLIISLLILNDANEQNKLKCFIGK